MFMTKIQVYTTIAEATSSIDRRASTVTRKEQRGILAHCPRYMWPRWQDSRTKRIDPGIDLFHLANLH